MQTRLAVDYKNVITGGIGSGNCGGRFATEMKRAGYDHIVIKGQASHWCYLLIKDDRVVFREARDLIGLGTWDLDAAIKKREDSEALSILGIGPAGECHVVFAAMISDRGRAVGYGGSGAVMGSKRLKAVAVTGTHTVQVARPDALDRRLKGFEANVLQKSDLVKTYEAGGTLGAYLIPGENRPHGVRNLNESFWGNEALKRVAREQFDAFLIRRQSCADCPVHCSGIFKVDDLTCEGIQANSLRAFGTNVDVSCARDILYAHALCNTLGLDVDQTSAVIAWAIDCFEQGIIDAKDTDGMELKFGDGRCVCSDDPVKSQTGRASGIFWPTVCLVHPESLDEIPKNWPPWSRKTVSWRRP